MGSYRRADLVVHRHPELRDLRVFALDEDWTRSLLANPEARMVLRRLLQAGQSWALIQQVVPGPRAFRLRLYRSKDLFKYEITSEGTRQWLDDLLILALAGVVFFASATR